MHWCPDCGQPCFCDGDDTDYGNAPLSGKCSHFCEEPEWEEEEEPEEDYNKCPRCDSWLAVAPDGTVFCPQCQAVFAVGVNG